MHADVGLVSIATCCPHMRHLVAKDLFAVTNYGIEYLSRHCPLLEVSTCCMQQDDRWRILLNGLCGLPRTVLLSDIATDMHFGIVSCHQLLHKYICCYLSQIHMLLLVSSRLDFPRGFVHEHPYSCSYAMKCMAVEDCCMYCFQPTPHISS